MLDWQPRTPAWPRVHQTCRRRSTRGQDASQPGIESLEVGRVPPEQRFALAGEGISDVNVPTSCKSLSGLTGQRSHVFNTAGSHISLPRPSTRSRSVSYTHLRAHETDSYLVCRLLLEKKKKKA